MTLNRLREAERAEPMHASPADDAPPDWVQRLYHEAVAAGERVLLGEPEADEHTGAAEVD